MAQSNVEKSANISLNFSPSASVHFATVTSVGPEGAVSLTGAMPRLEGVKACNFTQESVPFWIQDILPDAWGEKVMRHELKKSNTPLNRITVADRLCFIGRDALGAIECLPEVRPEESTLENISDLGWLREETLKLIEHDEDCNLSWMQGSVSLGGARPKFFVDLDNNDCILLNRQASQREWIVKFNGPKDFKDGGNIEYAFMLLAQQAGLFVPPIRLLQGKYFAIERFDHGKGERYWARTFSSLNNASHQDAMVNSYDALADKLGVLAGDYRQVEQVARLALFNQISGNNDDHAKNVTFLMNKRRQWALAPFYDLTFNLGFGNRAMAVNDTTSPDLGDFEQAFSAYGIRRNELKSMIDRIESAFADWDDVALKAGVTVSSSEFIKETVTENFAVLDRQFGF
jgi:serine/threonine-protein kinase HipA